ncbi:MAG: hypothetical protein J5I90_15710 [Caldilineales bacterium]|nr:hypothetical protein [Caldilineales bacterium]
MAIFGFVCLLIPTLFITLTLLTPSDCARLADGTETFTPIGVAISPYNENCGDWREGDIVTTAAGRSMESWAQDLFRTDVDRPQWQFGQQVAYTIERDGQPQQLALTLGRLPVAEVLAERWGALLFALVSQIVALFVLIQRPHYPAARALFIWAFAGSHIYGWAFFLHVDDITNALGFWSFRAVTPFLWLIYFPAALHVALVFPRPLPVVSRYRWLVPLLYPLSFAGFLFYIALAWPRSANMLVWLNTWIPAEAIMAAVFLLATIIVIVIQYRSTRTEEDRLRMRWAAFGATTAGALGLIFWNFLPMVLGRDVFSANAQGIVMLLFPLSLAVAIWRHQLFDIDIIIRKTLAYGFLTAILTVVFFGLVTVLSSLFASISGQQSALALVLSTLTIAALFSPLRHRIQDVIDRRFYRSKYDAERVLAAFSQTVRNETDLDTLLAELARVVEETMQPERVHIWMKPPSKQ